MIYGNDDIVALWVDIVVFPGDFEIKISCFHEACISDCRKHLQI